MTDHAEPVTLQDRVTRTRIRSVLSRTNLAEVAGGADTGARVVQTSVEVDGARILAVVAAQAVLAVRLVAHTCSQ